MKRHFLFLGLAWALASTLSAQSNDGPFYIDVSVGYGLSSAAYESVTASYFGDAVFGDSTLFSETPVFTPDYLKRGTVSIDCYIADDFALRFGIGYSSRPFTFTFKKNTAPTDYVFHAYYEMLEYVLGVKAIMWEHVYVGTGITINHLINKSAYISYDGATGQSALSLAEDNSSFYLDLGARFKKGPSLIYCYFEIHGDASEVFPYYYAVSMISLVDLSLNLGVSVPL